jgi:3D (Asp-Asp-Asp) domain-containing protein
MKRRGGLVLGALWLGGLPQCATSGSSWVAEPFEPTSFGPPSANAAPTHVALTRPLEAHRIGGAPDPLAAQKLALQRADPAIGRRLGVFRNTYYDFPEERQYAGDPVDVFDASCQPLARVPLEFHDSICMQGSGLLADGRTLSFARRGCSCARRCPRSDQQICFEALPAERFPWGRGATGEPIVPLLTVAVDSNVIPLGTPLFIPEYLGLPRDPDNLSSHDGCFIAQDRGIKVRGEHIDVFTGEEVVTRLWNGLVPSNQGVTVLVDSPFCARFSGSLSAGEPAAPAAAETTSAKKRPGEGSIEIRIREQL